MARMAGCCMSCTPALPSLGLAYSHALVSYMKLCHRSEKDSAKMVLGLEKSLELLLVATHT